jgi:hypothetical protein
MKKTYNTENSRWSENSSQGNGPEVARYGSMDLRNNILMLLIIYDTHYNDWQKGSPTVNVFCSAAAYFYLQRADKELHQKQNRTDGLPAYAGGNTNSELQPCETKA